MGRANTKTVISLVIAAIIFLIIGLNTPSGYSYVFIAAAGAFAIAAISTGLYINRDQSRHSVPLESTVRDI